MEVINILITGARIIHTEDGDWHVYYKDQLIDRHGNKATALCHALDQDTLDLQFDQRHQKID